MSVGTLCHRLVYRPAPTQPTPRELGKRKTYETEGMQEDIKRVARASKTLGQLLYKRIGLAYHTTMRSSGARYILSPGLVPKASWNSLMFFSA